MTTRHWVVGGRGLVGSAVVRLLSASGNEVIASPPVRWGSPHTHADLAAGLQSVVHGSEQWQVLWCAGASVTGSSRLELDAELADLRSFVDEIQRLAPSDRDRGSIVFASSAGGVYGGASGAPFDEYSATVPLGEYGATKLRAEQALMALSSETGLRVLVARIANVYGPGQNLGKQQGLISRLCVAALTRTTVPVYVSLDTLRDYIFVDDCAELIVACARRLAGAGGESKRSHIKVIATGRGESIAAVLSHFRLAGVAPPAIYPATSPSSALHGADLRLRSRYWTDLDGLVATTLPAGIARTIEDMRRTRLQPGLLAGVRGWEQT